MLSQNSREISIFLSGKQLKTKNTFSPHGICAPQREFQATDKLLKSEYGEVHCVIDLNYSR